MIITIHNDQAIHEDFVKEALVFIADHFSHFGYMPIEFEYGFEVFDIEVSL